MEKTISIADVEITVFVAEVGIAVTVAEVEVAVTATVTATPTSATVTATPVTTALGDSVLCFPLRIYKAIDNENYYMRPQGFTAQIQFYGEPLLQTH